MVYHGKPSTACRTCRQRRIKCDEFRPTCQQCARSRRTCLGYPDPTDLFFQNQTTAVIRRAKRINEANARKAAASDSPASSSSSSASSETDAPSRHGPAGLSGVVPMDARVLTNSIFVNPAEPIENRALTFFLTAMIVEPLSVGRAVGHLELVPRLYLQSLSTSALAKVTTAMSISAFCVVGSDTTIVRQRAYVAYGEAVTELWRALRDEKERAKNETLLACVLMVVVESLLSQGSAPTEQWNNHVRGASELLRQRDRDNLLKDPVGRRLFTVVRRFLSPHPEADFGPDDIFHNEIPAAPGATTPPETHLGRLTMRIADLRIRGFAALVHSSSSRNAISPIVAECRSMNETLLAWEDRLPDGYRYTSVDKADLRQHTHSSRAQSNAASPAKGLLPTQLHHYSDPHTQRVWNSYRVGRITINVILYRAATLPIASDIPDLDDQDPASLAATLGTLAGDILASIPPDILNPAAFDRDSSKSKAAEIALAYYCLFPLYIARGIVTLPAELRWHIRCMMQRIVDRYEVRHGLDLMTAGDAEVDENDGMIGGGGPEDLQTRQVAAGGGGDRPLWGDSWGDDWMECVWEWTFLYGCGAI